MRPAPPAPAPCPPRTPAPRSLPQRSTRAAFAALALLAAPAAAQTVAVSAQCNIYGAGHSAPPASCQTDIGPGILPVLIGLPSGAGAAPCIELHDVAGSVLYCPTICAPANGPDGAVLAFSLDPLDGISGITASRARFLEGVFLTDAEPADPAPPSLTFTDFSFTDLSPGIAQHFFIGDGLTGDAAGAVQRFHVPAGATRLFLGFSDGFSPCVGAYGDNSGQVTATVVPCAITAQPAPQLTCRNGSAPFSVSVSGTGPFTYQWQLQTAPGVWQGLGNDPFPLSCAPGAFAYASPINSPSVNIGVRPCPGQTHYQVRCIVTGPCGPMTSAPAAYTICPTDFDCNHAIEPADIAVFVNTWFTSLQSGSLAGDFDGNGSVEPADIAAFVNAWSNALTSGC